jgi:AcrR family transcriptional regulator
MPRLAKKATSDAASHIKLTARRLFATRGIDGVTVREIAKASGQKNHSAVGYHFGSKEALVREIILDGAIRVDERRNNMLDDMEESGGPDNIRDVVNALIYPSLGLAEDGSHEDSYISFANMLVTTHEEFFMETLDNRWNSGYLRCLDHLRRLMPEMPLAAKNQRFVFMSTIWSGVLAMRERALAESEEKHKTWSATRTLEHLALTMTALLEAPLDEALLQMFNGPTKRKKNGK